MKPAVQPLCLLSTFVVIICASPYANYSQSAAAKQINGWQHEYNEYIL